MLGKNDEPHTAKTFSKKSKISSFATIIKQHLEFCYQNHLKQVTPTSTTKMIQISTIVDNLTKNQSIVRQIIVSDHDLIFYILKFPKENRVSPKLVKL